LRGERHGERLRSEFAAERGFLFGRISRRRLSF
jgi:hypothetical protein